MCIGCVTVYPSAILTVILLLVLNSSSFAIVLPIALASFALNLTRFLSKGHRLSVLFNTFLGISLGASVLSVIDAPDNLQLGAVLVLLAVAITFSFAKGYRVHATCRSCKRYREWPHCYKPSLRQVDECHQIQSK